MIAIPSEPPTWRMLLMTAEPTPAFATGTAPIAAAVVGGASLRGGVGTMSGTILGALFLTLVVNGIPNIIKIESTLYEGIVVGVVVILAVAVNQIRGRRFGG